MLFTNVMLLWFWCAVFYNNTKDPLEIPDYSRQAKWVAIEEIWISVLAPWGTMLLMFIFWAFFKIQDHRLRQANPNDNLEAMLKELHKEMMLRMVMAYFVTFAIFSTVFWYVIKFTATFGWKVSW